MADSSATPLGGDLTSANRFIFELDGTEIGVFREVHGLQVTVAVHEFAEGGQNAYSHRVPGRMSWPNLVFKRGLTDSNALFEWLERSSGEGFAAEGSKLTRSTGAVTAIDTTGTRLRTWEFFGVFPVRWRGPEFSVDSSTPLEEELEVAHHGFRARAVT